MTASVLISFRLSPEMRAQFAEYCSQADVSVSEALRRMIQHAIDRKSVTPDHDVWEVIAKGHLPEGHKNRFALFPELTKGLPPKDYEGEDPWNIRPENPWKTKELF